MLICKIKEIAKETSLYDIFRRVKQKNDLRNWKKNGRLGPMPDLMKQKIVKEYARKFSVLTMVETGTFFGDMIYATKNLFDRIYSIELEPVLCRRAQKRFSRFRHISIVQGSSAKVLPVILSDITQSCLFWLDAHYSGGITARDETETPIMQELTLIMNHPVAEHVILIDDAREFVGLNDYPTIENLQNFIHKQRPDWVFEVKDDIIRIHKGCRS